MRQGTIILDYGQQGCTISFPPIHRKLMAGFVADLRRGRRWHEFTARYPAELVATLNEVESLGLLADAAPSPPRSGVAGATFRQELDTFSDRVLRRLRPPFYERLSARAVNRNQLIGYVLEYYHIVNSSIRVLAPILGHDHTPKVRRTLEDFVRGEFRHEELLMRSLAAVGLLPDAIGEAIPLTPTFAIIATLGVLASQDPLSFKAVLFLFERKNHEYHAAFEVACQRVRLPTAFIEPVLAHAHVNDDAMHEDITRELLDEVPFVSSEETIAVKKHVFFFLETIVALEYAILDVYRRSGRLMRPPVP